MQHRVCGVEMSICRTDIAGRMCDGPETGIKRHKAELKAAFMSCLLDDWDTSDASTTQMAISKFVTQARY